MLFGLKGNGLEVDLLEGEVTLNGKKYEIDEFKNMCFKNGWEGTLHKIIIAEKCLTEAVCSSMEKLKNKTNPNGG